MSRVYAITNQKGVRWQDNHRREPGGLPGTDREESFGD